MRYLSQKKLVSHKLDFNELCEKLRIPSAIYESAVDLNSSVYCYLQKYFSNDNIMIYCLYECMIRHNVPRTPEEVAHFADINPGVLWKIEMR